MSWFYQSEAQDFDSLGKRWSSFQVEMRKQVAMRVPGHPQPRTLRWGPRCGQQFQQQCEMLKRNWVLDPVLSWELSVMWINIFPLSCRAFLVTQTVNGETQVWSLGRKDPLEKGVATHSSILAWRIPWTEELGRLRSMGLQRVEHNWVTNTLSFKPVPAVFLKFGG